MTEEKTDLTNQPPTNLGGKIRVAIVDHYRLLREALTLQLNRQPDIEVVGEAETGVEAVELAKKIRPHILLLETSLPNKDGIDATKDIVRLAGSTKVLVLTTDTAPHHAFRMMRAGARGFLPKTVGIAEIAQAVRAVHRGVLYLREDLQQTFAEWHLRPNSSGQPEDQLSDREFQVMKMLAKGATNREIADSLHISVKTVDTHRSNLLRKLGLRNNADIARFAIRHRFITPE